MELLWAIPALMGVAGLAALLAGSRALGSCADELRVQLERLGEVREAVGELRAARAATHAAYERLRDR